MTKKRESFKVRDEMLAQPDPSKCEGCIFYKKGRKVIRFEPAPKPKVDRGRE